MSDERIVSCVLAAAVAAGVAAALLRPSWSRRRRVALAVLPPAAAAALVLAVSETLMAPWRAFNEGRLAAAAAWLQGVPLYDHDGTGPILGVIYPPLAVLAYLPAAVVSDAGHAVVAGVLLTQVFFFAGPVAAILLHARRLGEPLLGAACAATFVAGAGATRALIGPAFWIHADAPALGCGALACVVLQLRTHPASRAPWLLAALGVALALASKQVMLPLLLAVPAWVAWTQGRLLAARFSVTLAAACAAVGLLCLAVADLDGIVLDVLVVPASHPWTAPASEALPGAAVDLAREAALPLALLGVAWALAPLRWREAAWGPWLFCGLACVPTALLGRVKMGGELNTLANVVFPVAVAAHLALLQALSVSRRGAALGLLPLALAAQVVLSWPSLRLAPLRARSFEANPMRTAEAWVEAHPQQTYFPHRPLVTLRGDGRAYHFVDGMLCRWLAGIEVPPEHLRAHLPRNLRWVAVVRESDFSARYLPEFSEVADVPGLSHHYVVKVRPAAAGSTAGTPPDPPAVSAP